MWKCPVCDKENNAATVCPTCGYDQTCDYERYPTAFAVTTATPTRTLRRQECGKVLGHGVSIA